MKLLPNKNWSLKSKDLPNLSLLIDKLNINKLKSNVKKFNMKNSLDQKGKDLLSFINLYI